MQNFLKQGVLQLVQIFVVSRQILKTALLHSLNDMGVDVLDLVPNTSTLPLFH